MENVNKLLYLNDRWLSSLEELRVMAQTVGYKKNHSFLKELQESVIDENMMDWLETINDNEAEQIRNSLAQYDFDNNTDSESFAFLIDAFNLGKDIRVETPNLSTYYQFLGTRQGSTRKNEKVINLFDLNDENLIIDLKLLKQTNEKVAFNFVTFNKDDTVIEQYTIWFSLNQKANTDYEIVLSKGKIEHFKTLSEGTECRLECSADNSTLFTIKHRNEIVFTAGDASFKMIYVEGGAEHNSFYIGETVVTRQLWQKVDILNFDPLRFAHYVAINFTEDINRPNHPITEKSHTEIHKFLQNLMVFTKKQFRLPTVEEWQFAAKGGVKSKGYKYSGGDDLDEVACTWHNCNGIVQPVKTRKGNELGLFDMTGNVWELCTRGSQLCLAGGCVLTDIEKAHFVIPYGTVSNLVVGFRLVLDL